jgi:hypothetical protein
LNTIFAIKASKDAVVFQEFLQSRASALAASAGSCGCPPKGIAEPKGLRELKNSALRDSSDPTCWNRKRLVKPPDMHWIAMV